MGLMTFSDGRRYQHDQLLPTNREYHRRVKEAIEGTGEAEVVEGREIVWSNAVAQTEARVLGIEVLRLDR